PTENVEPSVPRRDPEADIVRPVDRHVDAVARGVEREEGRLDRALLQDEEISKGIMRHAPENAAFDLLQGTKHRLPARGGIEAHDRLALLVVEPVPEGIARDEKVDVSVLEGLAGVADVVSVLVLLSRVGRSRTVVAEVAQAVAVDIALIRVRDRWAVVDVIRNAVRV